MQLHMLVCLYGCMHDYRPTEMCYLRTPRVLNSKERVFMQGAVASHGVTSNAEAAALQQPEHL